MLRLLKLLCLKNLSQEQQPNGKDKMETILLDKNIQESDLFEPIFDDVVTLDSSRVEEVWDRLSVDTHQKEIESLGQILALALWETIKESKRLHGKEKTTPRGKK